MGFIGKHLEKLDVRYGLYFFLLGDDRVSDHVSDFFRDRFELIAERIGENATIVKSYQGSLIPEELFEAIRLLDRSDGETVERIIRGVVEQSPALLILKKHPNCLTNTEEIIDCIPFTLLSDLYSNNINLLNALIDCARGGHLLKNAVDAWQPSSGVSFSLSPFPPFISLDVPLSRVNR